MTSTPSAAVVVDTMVISSLLNSARQPAHAAGYRSMVAGRAIVASFVTVTELRYVHLESRMGFLSASSPRARSRQTDHRAA